MKMKIWLAGILACGISSTAALGQQSTTPQPADSGPSLATTLQVLQSTLNEQGKLSWADHFHDSADGTNWISQLTFEVSKVVADASACSISYHYNITRDSVQISDTDTWFNLHDVQDVTLMTGEERQNENDAAGGHTTWTAKVVPPLFDLIVRTKDNQSKYNQFYFFFSDEDTANRVTKAMGYAVELCGGSRGSF